MVCFGPGMGLQAVSLTSQVRKVLSVVWRLSVVGKFHSWSSRLGPAVPSLPTSFAHQLDPEGRTCKSCLCDVSLSLWSTFPSPAPKTPTRGRIHFTSFLLKGSLIVPTFNDRKPCLRWIFIPFCSKGRATRELSQLGVYGRKKREQKASEAAGSGLLENWIALSKSETHDSTQI